MKHCRLDMYVLKKNYPLAERKTQWQILYFTVVVMASLFGMALWIAVGVVVSTGSKSRLYVTSSSSVLIPVYQCMSLILTPMFSDYILSIFEVTLIQKFNPLNAGSNFIHDSLLMQKLFHYQSKWHSA